MGVDNFTIHTDGVIERGQELEPVILNILEVGSHKMSPLAAYKAQRKCFKIAKKEREIDYKEYVERLQLDNYSTEFKKSEIGRRLYYYLWGTCVILLIGLLLFGIWAIDDFSHYEQGIGLFGLFLLVISGIGVWRVINLSKKIKEMIIS